MSVRSSKNSSSPATLCRIDMKTLQQNPAFVGDDGQSQASTLPMSVSRPQVSATTSTNRYILLHTHSRWQDNLPSPMATMRRASPARRRRGEDNVIPGAEAWSFSCPASRCLWVWAMCGVSHSQHWIMAAAPSSYRISLYCS